MKVSIGSVLLVIIALGDVSERGEGGEDGIGAVNGDSTLVSGSKGEVGVEGEGIGGPMLPSRSRKEPKLLASI
jgi:hypothetical protein